METPQRKPWRPLLSARHPRAGETATLYISEAHSKPNQYVFSDSHWTLKPLQAFVAMQNSLLPPVFPEAS